MEAFNAYNAGSDLFRYILAYIKTKGFPTFYLCLFICVTFVVIDDLLCVKNFVDIFR